MLDVTPALEIVLNHTVGRPARGVSLDGCRIGQILADDVASDIDSPPFDKSMMDGFALRAADSGPGVTLRIVGEVAAGAVSALNVNAGEAVRIMTGAPIPGGADAVVQHEATSFTHEVVTLKGAVPAGQFIITRGREMRAGEVVLPAGTVVTPAAIALLAAVGRTSASVYPAPRIAVVSTGDELMPADATPGAGMIRNTNGPLLTAIARQAGGVPTDLGIARDDRDELARVIGLGLDHDMLLLTGGVSAGQYDFVPEVLQSLGVEVHFHKVRLKPGKPLLFGTRGKTLVFGLPGNPVSAFVGFKLFVEPALRKMLGHPDPSPTFIPLPLAVPYTTQNNRPAYVPATLDDRLLVTPVDYFGSADLRSLAGAHALVRLPAGEVAFPAGAAVDTLLLNPPR